jgi:hypothetical protein
VEKVRDEAAVAMERGRDLFIAVWSFEAPVILLLIRD